MSYTALDRLIARMRFRAAYPHINPGSKVCDFGCGLYAAFLDFASDKIAEGVGVDDQVESGMLGRWRCLRSDLGSPLPLEAESFNHVTMLAVLEHLPQPAPILREAYRLLKAEGSLILTWPAAMVDPILNVMHMARLISSEMESQEHQKRIPVASLVAMLRSIGFRRYEHRRFEFGLNNLLVASK